MHKHGATGVILLGDVNIDVILKIPRLPPPGGDTLADGMEVRAGGSAANTAILLSRLGHETEMVTHTGKDAWAEIALAALRSEGVGVRFLKRDPLAGSGLIFITVTPDGERSMFSHRGANVLLPANEINKKMFSGAGWLHISGYAFLQYPQKDAAWRAVEMAEARQLPVSLDLGIDLQNVAGEDMEQLLGKLELLVLGEEEAFRVTRKPDLEQALDFLLGCGIKTIALKLGKSGCLLVTPHKRARLPGFVVKAVDATGAGDAFSAALIHGYLRGLSLEARGLLGNACGALAVTVQGGGAALPDTAALRSFLHGQVKGSQPWDGWVAEALSSLETEAGL